MTRFNPALMLIAVALLSGRAFSQSTEGNPSYILPNTTIQELFERDKNYARLDNLSPDGDHFLIPVKSELSSLELMSQRTLRLAMLELCPDVNREWRLSTIGVTGLKIYSLSQRRTRKVQLPPDSFFSHMTWSPDGARIAFLAHLPAGTQVWTADAATGRASALSQAYVMATLAAAPRRGPQSRSPLQWRADGSIVTLLVPADRGPEPEADRLPRGPMIRRSRDKPTPTRTLPFLLRTPHDRELFRYYTTSQLAVLAPGKQPAPIGEPAMFTGISLSPDDSYILAEKVLEPFSYIVGANDFARDLVVMDREGATVSTIRHLPLREAMSRTRGQRGPNQPRDVSWRVDGSGLSFLWREKREEDAEDSGPRNDRLMTVAAPFDISDAEALITTEKRLSNVRFSKGGEWAFATLTHEGKQSLTAFNPANPGQEPEMLVTDSDPDDPLQLPGTLMTAATGNGLVYARLSSDGSSIFLRGPGHREDFRPQPFIDRVSITTAEKTRVFEGSTEMFEQPLVPVDADMSRIVINRESKTQFPDSYLWSGDGSPVKLTSNRDPFPEITAARRIDFEFERRDGLTVQARISLPVGYREGTRVPAVFWTYPMEYASVDDYRKYTIRGRRSVPNHNAFSLLSYLRWSDIWLTQGYAVVYPDVPIIGSDNTFNNNYISHMSDTLYAAIRKVDEMGWVDIDRIGHGGHSYGAFATANLLANTPYFKAGIAGDGAYNRTLTPMSFQGERRFIWEAAETYLEMSPFFKADHIDTPLLMYHGAMDNNSGTFLIQSERFIQALTGLGKEAVLYIYPFESHAPSSRESYLDLWARWTDWFDTHVKGAGSAATPSGR